MGFCRRCGEITIAERCKCGGTSKESAVKPLFNSSSTGDKWGQRYLSKSGQTSPSSSPGNKSPVPELGSSPFPSASSDRPPLRPTASSSSRPPSPSKLRSFIGEDDGELSSVFGSVLSPKDNWCCVACQSNFVQEEVIYPHPDAQSNPELKEVYFCRPCFADRFAKGVCKKCKCAVLSDAPFIKHSDKLWHDSCYSCSYCPATEDIIIDFGGQPSCESCFDSAAYKTRGVPPSPHLAQGAFAAPAQLRPAPSKWGRDSVGGKARESLNIGGASIPGDVKKEEKDGEKEKATRLRMEREKSPMVPSFEELGEKLRRAGLEGPAPSTTRKPPVIDIIKPVSSPKPSPRETTRPLANSSPYQRTVKPLPIPPAFSKSPPTTSTTTPRPTHTRAWSMNPTPSSTPISGALAAPPSITPSATNRPSHTRAWSLNSTPATATPVASHPYTSTTTPPSWTPPSWKRPSSAVSSSPWSKAVQAESPPRLSDLSASTSPTRPTPLLPTVPRRHLHVSLKPFDTKPIPSSLASPIKGVNSPKKGGPVAEETCPACTKPLGYGEFIQLPKTGEVLHRGCFACGGCGEQLDAGSHTETEGKVWHAQCAPAPQRYRSIVTSLAEPPSPTSPTSPTSPFSHMPLAVPVAETAICSACSKDLGVGYSITIPRSGKSYHTDCFCCGSCGKGFGTVQGQRSFVEVNGEPFHSHCAPKLPSTASAPSPHACNPLRTSTSRASPLPTAPSPPKIAHPPPRDSLTTGTTSPLPKSPSQPSIFATRPRPPSNLGGLLICSGCSVRATMSETVSGPRGRRYHARCLVCGGCKRGLDSEARVGEGGELRCEACRRQGQAIKQALGGLMLEPGAEGDQVALD